VNPAIKEIRGWAWNCGAGILPLFKLVTEDKTPSDKVENMPVIVRQIVTKKQNEQSSEIYEKARDLLNDLVLNARLKLKLPKTLSAFRRERHPFQRVERDLYREFLCYGITVAEVMSFAFTIGVIGLVKQRNGYSKKEKHDLLEAWEKAAIRAEEDFSKYKDLFDTYLNSDLEGSMLVNKAADIFYGEASTGEVATVKAIWLRIAEAAILSPNIGGIGVDIKKL